MGLKSQSKLLNPPGLPRKRRACSVCHVHYTQKGQTREGVVQSATCPNGQIFNVAHEFRSIRRMKSVPSCQYEWHLVKIDPIWVRKVDDNSEGFLFRYVLGTTVDKADCIYQHHQGGRVAGKMHSSLTYLHFKWHNWQRKPSRVQRRLTYQSKDVSHCQWEIRHDEEKPMIKNKHSSTY